MKNTHKNKGIFFKENKLAKFTLSGDLIKKYIVKKEGNYLPFFV